MHKQLILIHRAGFSYYDVDTMPIYELEQYFQLFQELKQQEHEAIEDLKQNG